MPLEVEAGKILGISRNILSKLGNLEKKKVPFEGQIRGILSIKIAFVPCFVQSV